MCFSAYHYERRRIRLKESASNLRDDAPYEQTEGLSPLAVGYSWVVRITTFCFEFVALILLGRYVDVRFDVAPWGLVVGASIGVYVFVTGLVAIVRRLEAVESRDVDKR